MNKIYKATQVVVLVILSLCCYQISFAGTTNSRSAEDKQIAQRVESLHSIVDMRYTPEVSKIITQYTKKYTRSSSILLGQSSVYFPIIENILRERNMPEHLKYLAVVESSLRPAAKSRVGATGMWQFMKSTGRMYGLTINNTLDERKDVFKSTNSAIDYLQDLHERFGDWALAMAAYNCGPGTVNRAIRKSGGSKDFWVIKKYLPKETRRYIPKFIAMQYMMSYYHMHDIQPNMPESDYRYIASTKVYKKVNFKELSKNLNLDLSIIKKLNPAYSRNYIPLATGKHTLTLPEEKLFTFVANNGSFDDVVYKRKPIVVKETIDTHVERIALSIDKISSITLLPISEMNSNLPKDQKRISSAQKVTATPTQRKSHTIQKGQSLNSIAKLYGISLAHLLKTNNITGFGDIELGDTLIIEL